jgi:hypothetical protein
VICALVASALAAGGDEEVDAHPARSARLASSAHGTAEITRANLMDFLP